ncbi:hypothetical protein D3C76_1504940 [compost metagenome]
MGVGAVRRDAPDPLGGDGSRSVYFSSPLLGRRIYWTVCHRVYFQYGRRDAVELVD